MDDNGPATSFLREDGAPDWDAITFDVCCSRCGYNLRTLSRPLCPECGLTFEWREVLDRSAFTSDFLFEHQWRTRPIGSLALTIWRSFRPRAFWSRVSIHEHVRPGPLIVFPLLAVIAFPVAFHGISFLSAAAYELVNGPIVPTWSWTAYQSGVPVTVAGLIGDSFFDLKQMALLPFYGTSGYYWIFPFTLVYFLVPTLLLCALRQTLGRCKVRSVQIARVVAYSSVPIAIWGAVIAVASSFVEHLSIPLGAAGETTGGCGILITLILMTTVFLRAGLKHYLRLPRPGLLAGAASLVGMGVLINEVFILNLE
ncbi:hypothetical protein B7486_04200 [cyanobacterium TDX16]|nr:hypothetical protein B7486_04200 [cyanobacterium TDX16]